MAVFEDSSSGMRSALAAKVAFAIGVMTSLNEEAFRKIGASYAVKDFTDTAILETVASLAGVRQLDEEKAGVTA